VEKIKHVYKNLQKKQCIKVPQHQQAYRYVGLFLIETLKHSNNILEYSIYIEYSILEYLKNVHEITEKYKLQAVNNILTRLKKDKTFYYYDFSLRIKMIQNLILV
jgi:hypothetical protein